MVVLGYAVISPVINGFGAVYFVLSAVIYKYLYIWVYDSPDSTETGGSFFPKAVSSMAGREVKLILPAQIWHVFVGIYVNQICLCALFFLARDENLKVAALGQGIIMIVFIVVTVGRQGYFKEKRADSS